MVDDLIWQTDEDRKFTVHRRDGRLQEHRGTRRHFATNKMPLTTIAVSSGSLTLAEKKGRDLNRVFVDHHFDGTVESCVVEAATASSGRRRQRLEVRTICAAHDEDARVGPGDKFGWAAIQAAVMWSHDDRNRLDWPTKQLLEPNALEISGQKHEILSLLEKQNRTVRIVVTRSNGLRRVQDVRPSPSGNR
jgi:hypothetical protein